MFFFFDDNKTGVPGFEQTIKPILIALKEKGGRATIVELDEATIRIMNLSEEVIKIMHKGSSKQSEISYRMAWGRTYLKKYGLITNVARGVWAFTDKYDGNIDKIDVDEIVRKVRSDNIGGEEDKMSFTDLESALAFKNMVGALLQELASKEGKQVYYTYSDFVDFGYDIILPNGLEGLQEEIKCIIKYVNVSKQNVFCLYDKVKIK